MARTAGRRAFSAVAVLLVLAILFSKSLVHLCTEAWWFASVGFSGVFWTRLTWQALLFAGSFLAYGGVLWGTYTWASQQLRTTGWVADPLPRAGVRAGILVFSLSAAGSSLSAWLPLLAFLNATPFGRQDPIFGRDIAYYLFTLPLVEGLHRWLLGLVLAAGVVAAGVYLLQGGITLRPRVDLQLTRAARLHLGALLGTTFLLVAWGFWLQRFQLLTSMGKVVFGASYTDVHARLLACAVMVALSVGMAILAFMTMTGFRPSLLGKGLVMAVISYALFHGLWPWFMQQFLVNPNELTKEKPYLEHNIKFTQAAYNLGDVQTEAYSPAPNLNRAGIEANQSTIDNIRLWDYRPILATYKQLQEIRLYYQFKDVDIDRYNIAGNIQQVMLSARELFFERLPRQAQTWVNRHLKYTHGYGLVMSPVNRASADGLPELYIKDIPPVSTVDLAVEQAAIYYGEATDQYIFTGTSTEEFDFPAGDTNAYTRYAGKGGVPLTSMWRRLAYAYDFAGLEVLISEYLTDQSRIHYHRQVRERASHVAPFLRFDNDPYLAVIDGRLQWLLDAYTVSDHYPYSQPIGMLQQGQQVFGDSDGRPDVAGQTNYIRNAVKVLVDAYDGSLRFMVVDETDPVLSTYRKIFPDLFEPAASTPATVSAHFRYPEDLFKIQMSMYQTYHMNDPQSFYNREDLWSLPKQTYEGDEGVMEPYYIIMRLPGEEKLGFILIQPFTPANKDNMTAWMAARSNGKDSGPLVLYQFPKKMLVYGPRQIEARIDQDPQISQQLTLWSQAGSKVIRGNLLIIPIDQSLLYVEPVYLRADRGALPELKRVIVVYDQSVVMETSLNDALDVIFSGSSRQRTASATTRAGEGGGGLDAAIPKAALDSFRRSQDALRQGNWADYGRHQKELERTLQRMAP